MTNVGFLAQSHKRDDGKVRLILPPWAGQLNGFSPLFEAFIIKFCKHLPVHHVCQRMNISDYKVWELLDIYVDKARPSEDLSGGFKRYRTLWYAWIRIINARNIGSLYL